MRDLVLALAITGLLFQLVLSTGANRGRSSWQGLSQGAWCAVLVTALLGFVWGRVITGISANVEYALWLICIPAAAWVAWWTGPTLSKVFEIGKGVIVVLLLEAILAVFLAPFWQAVSWVAPGAIVLFVADATVRAPSRRWADDPKMLAGFRRAIGAGAFSFYIGYGIGWLALWGYFGV